MKRYFIDATILNSHLISLKKFDIYPSSTQLERNQNITVKLYIDDKQIYTFDNCHIDDTDDRRLRIPDEVAIWLRQTFEFSVAYFASHSNDKRVGVWKKKDQKRFDEAIKEDSVKMDIPAETILLSWESDQDGSYLLIKEGFKITCENATKYLSEKALASVLPYIFSTVKNTSITDVRGDGKKCYIIDETTNWLSVAQYGKKYFSHPGLYILRRRLNNNEFAYYIGKADDIKNRIIGNDKKLSHPDEKDDGNKQYDEVACIAINFDDYVRLFGELNDANRTPQNNPGVKRGSNIDYALYGVEDIAIHIAAMILRSEGRKLDNKQYRSYTSQQINGINIE